MNQNQKDFRRKAGMSFLIMILFMLIFGLVSVTGVIAQTGGSESGAGMSAEQAGMAKIGFIAAAAAFGFGAIGAGIAIANVGAAAMAAIGEKPEIASQALIFIALAEGLVVFGFITALMILGKF